MDYRGEGRQGANEQHPSGVKTYNLARRISNCSSIVSIHGNFLLSLSTVHQSCSRFRKLRVNSRKRISLSLSLPPRLSTEIENRTKFNLHPMRSLSHPIHSKEFRIIHVHASLIDRVITFDYSLLISPAAIIVSSF